VRHKHAGEFQQRELHAGVAIGLERREVDERARRAYNGRLMKIADFADESIPMEWEKSTV
jgi:hypothetical protein